MEQNTQKNGLINLLVLLVVGVAGFAVARYANSLAGLVSTGVHRPGRAGRRRELVPDAAGGAGTAGKARIRRTGQRPRRFGPVRGRNRRFSRPTVARAIRTFLRPALHGVPLHHAGCGRLTALALAVATTTFGELRRPTTRLGIFRGLCAGAVSAGQVFRDHRPPGKSSLAAARRELFAAGRLSLLPGGHRR